MEALRQIDDWPCDAAAVAVVQQRYRQTSPGTFQSDPHILGMRGSRADFAWTSVTKLLTAYAVLIAYDYGHVDLDENAGPDGSTLRHLLAHASGLPTDGDRPIARPGERRIYSNTGFEIAARLVAERLGTSFADVLQTRMPPLSTNLKGRLTKSPAYGYVGPIDDLVELASELLDARTLPHDETLDEATEVAFPGLVGVLPGFGRMEPNDWGLGFELRNDKQPHWTGSRNSRRTFGHFGRSGTFLWVDPEARIALACLTDREFGDWAKEAWPRLSNAVLAEAGTA